LPRGFPGRRRLGELDRDGDVALVTDRVACGYALVDGTAGAHGANPRRSTDSR
jgi:hypothetical protein